MTNPEFSQRLGRITTQQFQAALDHFNLGQFIRAEAIPFGLFGQNVFVTSTAGEFVLRGSAHYDWQFPQEQFIANLLHDQTSVPVPWPYLLDTDEMIFGWKFGYVIMPRMPGLQLADKHILKSLSQSDRAGIADAIGENLRQIQQVEWPFAGRFDLHTQTVQPFKDGFVGWLIGGIRDDLGRSLAHDTGMTAEDVAWAESIIRESEAALQATGAPVLVMHDYKEANLTVEKEGQNWRVSGVFDLMEALFGDGELDLVRQLAAYLEEDFTLAKSFLAGYRRDADLRTGASERLRVYLLYDRLVVWEYFHRPDTVSQWWYGEKNFKAWLTRYFEKLAELLD
jgi:aminoglycoside phosphotransferase (APT) family kinase protein